MKKTNKILVTIFGFLLMFGLVMASTTLKDVIVKDSTNADLNQQATLENKAVSQVAGEKLDKIIEAEKREKLLDRYHALEWQVKADEDYMNQTIEFWEGLLK